MFSITPATKLKLTVLAALLRWFTMMLATLASSVMLAAIAKFKIFYIKGLF